MALARIRKHWRGDTRKNFRPLWAVLGELRSLAEILGAPNPHDLPSGRSHQDTVRARVEEHENEVWLFTVNVTSKPVTAAFCLSAGAAKVRVHPENRMVIKGSGDFRDELEPYESRIYRIEMP